MTDPREKDFSSCVIVINPSRFPYQVRRLKRLLRSYTVPALVETRSRSHFLETVRSFTGGEKPHLLVWGGDGTAHDAINEIITSGGPADKSVGFLRGGSGNGIQDSYEVPFTLPRQVAAYAESVKNGYTIAVDLLRVTNGENREFGQLVGLGWDVRLLEKRDKRTAPDGSAKPGFMNYLVSGAATILGEPLRDHRSYTLRLEDGKYVLRGTRINAEFPFRNLAVPSDAPMIEIGTRPYYGLLFKVCPDVVCNDGSIGLYIFNFQNKADILRDPVSLWNGLHHRINRRFAKKEKPIIQRFEIRGMTIECDEPFPYHVDGELRTCAESRDGKFSLRIDVMPGSFSFLVPGVFYRKFHPFQTVSRKETE